VIRHRGNFNSACAYVFQADGMTINASRNPPLLEYQANIGQCLSLVTLNSAEKLHQMRCKVLCTGYAIISAEIELNCVINTGNYGW
jgi:hypothetical protein